MSVRERLPGALLALAGLAVAVEASTFDVAFMTDPVGPKALPYLVAVILVLGGVHATLRPTDDFAWPRRGELARTATATAALLVYAAALPVIGFFTSTTLVVAVLSRLFGATPRKAFPSAALLASALWLIFVQGLGLPLPIGSLWIR